jgi:hypothetical protein
MTLILDKTHSFVRNCCPAISSLTQPLTETVIEYLPTAFDTLTRGLNKRGLKPILTDTLSTLQPETIQLIYTYLDNQQTLLCLLDRLIDRETTTSYLVQQIETENWDDPIFQQPNIDRYFLEAVRQGRLTEFEFSSLCLMQTAQTQWMNIPLKMPLLLGQGQINPTALALVEETLKLSVQTPTPLLSLQQREVFLSEIFKLSPLDRLISFQPLFDLPKNNMLRATQRSDLNLFGETSLKITVVNHFWRTTTVVPASLMIAPLGLIQAFLRAKFEVDAVDLLPAIGFPGIAELRDNGLHGTRIVSLHHSFLEELTAVQLPLKADGLEAPGVYFTYHDSCYHSYLSSSVSHPLRQRFVHLHDSMKKHRAELVAKGGKKADVFFRKVGFELVDMEHTAFRPDYEDGRPNPRSNSIPIFWRTVAFVLNKHSKKAPHGLFEDCTVRFGQFLVRHNFTTSKTPAILRREKRRANNFDDEKPLMIVFDYLLKGIESTSTSAKEAISKRVGS